MVTTNSGSVNGQPITHYDDLWLITAAQLATLSHVFGWKLTAGAVGLAVVVTLLSPQTLCGIAGLWEHRKRS